MAQNRDKDDTLELQVPADSPLSLSGCGSIGPEPARLDRIDACRPRSDHHTPQPTQERKRTATDQPSRPDTAKRPVNRCSGCSKRVGLTGFRCRCGDLFCSHHRYSDRHDCSYDYKTAGREAIARENPVVRAPKILKV